ncbi:MAG: tRNA (guanosine(46)-N7)-methyltransferase TrmB [Alphaproteobacteria bacterium]
MTGNLRHERRRVFGRRRGKPLSASRQALVDRLMPDLAIDLPDGALNLDPKSWFANPVDSVWLEIGFGKGEHLAWQAQNNPDIGFIGCEPYETGAASLFTEVEARGLSNLRYFADDAAFLLAALAPASLHRVFLLFPDPWPKARHHKRRFVNAANLDLLAAAMVDGAELRIATDHAGYLDWILTRMVSRPDFSWMAEKPADWRGRTADWPQTRYEAKALEDGLHPAYLRYLRKPR